MSELDTVDRDTLDRLMLVPDRITETPESFGLWDKTESGERLLNPAGWAARWWARRAKELEAEIERLKAKVNDLSDQVFSLESSDPENCASCCNGSPVAELKAENERLTGQLAVMINDRDSASHEWVPVEECGELERGFYIVGALVPMRSNGVETEEWFIGDGDFGGGEWLVDFGEVAPIAATHVLNPQLGPVGKPVKIPGVK